MSNLTHAAGRRHSPTLALVESWLILDFFADARRRGRVDGGATLTTGIFTQSFIAFLFAALLFDRSISHTAFAAANLSLTSLMIAFTLFAEPPSRDRRIADRTLIGTAPGGMSVWRSASILHGSFFVLLITTGLAIPGAVLSAWLADDAASGGVTFVVHVLAALLCGGVVAGFVQLVLKAATAWTSPEGAALTAGSVRAALLGAGFAAFAAFIPFLDDGIDSLPLPRFLVSAWPAFIGAQWAASPWDASRPGILLAALVGLFALGAIVSRLESNATRGQRPTTAPLGRLSATLTKPGGAQLLGAAAFTGIMLLRSAGLRARVLPLFGLPIAMAGLVVFHAEDLDAQLPMLGAILQFPAIYMPFLVLFLPSADEPRANHIFETAPIAPSTRNRLARRASLAALATRILLPASLLGGALVLAVGVDVLQALSMAAFGFGLSILATELHLLRLRGMPFTLAPEPGRNGENDLGGMVFTALVLAALGGGHATVADSWFGLATAAGVAALGVSRLIAHGHDADTTTAATRADPTDQVDAEPVGDEEETEAHEPDSSLEPAPERSLRGELRAVLALYGFIAILPLLVGFLVGV